MTSAYAQSDLVKRGDYLVNTIMTCANCHTPKGPTGDIAEKAFSGGLSWDEPPFKVTASNITQDKETGIGSWTDAQIKMLLRTGKRPNGVQIAEVMPTAFYGIISDRDMNAIVAYLRTIKPISNKVPDPIYRMQLPHHAYPGSEKPYTEATINGDKLKKGFYLATIGHCMECHTPFKAGGGKDFVGDLGKGGMEFPGPWGKSVSRNITPSKTKGIGAWTDAEIKTAITTGKDKDGKPLKPPMGYHYYSKMTGEDLDAVIAYLRTVPAQD
ncbi:phosphomannomutase [Pseudolabrys taiwanensis]|uniref:Phosphomannomutase n=2 Tax=Pseudolabrys taiwanensis TaxID=331696 RepID=A0A346A3T5_9HYPH|nr:phosphomannomutase [Pseudolabrys taiwanensis]